MVSDFSRQQMEELLMYNLSFLPWRIYKDNKLWYMLECGLILASVGSEDPAGEMISL